MCYDIFIHGTTSPFVSNDVFEQDILHVAVAKAAEQTGHHRSLRNPLALTVRPAAKRRPIIKIL